MAHLRFSNKKANLQIFQDEFNRHQQEGYIGDPNGENGYGYLRVSSDGQTNEDRYGIPRQIENLHNAALRDNVRISWEWIYGDDESGYTTDRPALQELLETSRTNKKILHICFESIGRMSREWEWQQAWLLWQFEDLRHLTVHFFDEAGSPLERMFKGYVAGESMKQQRKLMMDGAKRKARNGFVPYGRPAFGFKAAAKAGYDPQKVREFCTWVVKREGDLMSQNGCSQYGEAKIVVEIFNMLAFDGLNTYTIAKILQEKYGAPRRYKRWLPVFITDIVRNPAYYGKFAANRWEEKKQVFLDDLGRTRRKVVRKERPESEWILVDVEPIVSKTLWDLANRALVQNKKTAPRNLRVQEFLLSGLLKCAHCGYAWLSHTTYQPRSKTNPDAPRRKRYYYRDAVKTNSKQYRHLECPTVGHYRAEVLDKVVWEAVRKVLFHPEVLLEYMDRQTESEQQMQVKSQIEFIQNQIERRKLTDKKDRELYDNGYMDMSEYGPRHKEMVAQVDRWLAAIEGLKATLINKVELEEKKKRILALAENAQRIITLSEVVPFETKRSLIKMCVDTVYIDEPAGEIRIEGELGPITRSVADLVVEDLRRKEQEGDVIVNGYSTPT